MGAVTRTEGPPRGGYQQGKVYTMQYDAVGRIQQVSTIIGGQYQYNSTRWVYPDSQAYVQQYEVVQDGTGEMNFGTLLDGAGRTRGSWREHPGSAGGFSGQYIKYDVMGRVVQQSNPTEMNGSWQPAGDDAAWVYTQQAYDWKGRPTVTTLADGWQRINSYGGCGCAGGEQVTATDESGRGRKLYRDVLGRLAKVEELNADASVYGTTLYQYNVRDQLTQITQHNSRIRSFDYDGHGRLWHRTTPEQGTTTYSYYGDDTLHTVEDARGATATYSYNGRHLVTAISYGVPAGVADTPNVTFTYDEAGNRLSMTDAAGSVSYSYDQFSRLTQETRSFTGVGSFTLNYSYNVAGQLTSLQNPFGSTVTYTRDRAGQVTSVSGTGAVSASSYVSSLTYRASGAAKQISYGNTRTLTLSYDSRLRQTGWDIPGVLGYSYSYDYGSEHGNKVIWADSLYDNTLDRAYGYDQVGRLTSAYTGSEARAAIGY